MSGALALVRRDQVMEALRRVLDPELDEDVVDLGFVTGIEVDGGEVHVSLRLPTYWCAPNFAWLMAADAREAILAVEGVRRATVVLQRHHAGEEISEGVNGAGTFEEVFAGDADGALEPLRRAFRRRAYLARLDRLVSTLRGRPASDVRLGAVAGSAVRAAYVRARSDLGFDCSPEAPLLLDEDGQPAADVERLLRRARAARVAREANAAFCRAVLDAAAQ
jgi:metal-sulfur cluster biosynthetic enzyme